MKKDTINRFNLRASREEKGAKLVELSFDKILRVKRWDKEKVYTIYMVDYSGFLLQELGSFKSQLKVREYVKTLQRLEEMKWVPK